MLKPDPVLVFQYECLCSYVVDETGRRDVTSICPGHQDLPERLPLSAAGNPGL